MSLILLATGLCGLLGTRLLLWSGVETPLVRFPLNVTIAYLGFFLFVKIWLWYISPRRNPVDAVDALDLIDVPFGSSTAASEPAFVGGGGSGGGGGASGSYGEDSGAGLADKLDVDIDGDFIWPLLLLAALLSAVFGVGIYLIYQAPVILTEAAFEFLLASGMIRRFRRMDDPDWLGSVFRMTWIPFVLVLMVSLVCAWIMQTYYPEALTLRDLFPATG